MTWHPTCHHTDPELEALTERFLTEPVKLQPRLFYLWGHAFEFERDNSWETMERFLRAMADNDTIWYAANGELCRYVRAFRMLESSNGNILYNPSAETLWLLAGGEKRKLLPGDVLNLG